jgi:L-seryl-tRNA(Ser) seleniumtransferase
MAHEPSDLPQIQTLLALPAIAPLIARYSHAQTAVALRTVIASLRADLLAGPGADLPDFTGAPFAARIARMIEEAHAPSLRPLINATGIVIHTNLGRAPLAPQAIAAMQAAAASFSNLELDLDSGKRGARQDHVEALICGLTGAQAAVVVNNCAAAVLLALSALAAGRDVIASRGELVEIGGSYRLPDVIAQSGAHLREVGTTNKTRISDYAGAVTPDTAVLLKSHTSNFRIIGFTSAPARGDLARLAAQHGLPLMEDLGSGLLVDLSPYGLGDEPVVADILRAGVDLVMFSGDKLLGGPQAGIIAGRSDLVARLKAHPLMRAVRIDKLSLAALEATLRLYRAPFDPVAQIPVLRMLAEPAAAVEARARALADALDWADMQVCASVAQVGAGALPEQGLESCAVSLRHATLREDALMAALRRSDPPVIGRIERGRVLLDMRTVSDAQVPLVARACTRIAGL